MKISLVKKLLAFAFFLMSPLSFAELTQDDKNWIREEILRAAQSVQFRNQSNEVQIGTISPFAGREDIALPQNYLICDGRWLKFQQNAQGTESYEPALFNVIGHVYTTPEEREANPGKFRLPDLRGKTPVGKVDQEGHWMFPLGKQFGRDSCRLNASNLPPHCHRGTTVATEGTHTHTGTTGNESHQHNHQYTGVHWNPKNTAWQHGANHGFFWTHAPEAEGLWIPRSIDTTNENHQHNHAYTTPPNQGAHQHTFTTDNGVDLNNRPFRLYQPSLLIRYIIKVR